MTRNKLDTSDFEKARRIRSLINDQDLLICLYPHLFAVEQMLRLFGMHSSRIRRFYDSRAEAMLTSKPSILLTGFWSPNNSVMEADWICFGIASD